MRKNLKDGKRPQGIRISNRGMHMDKISKGRIDELKLACKSYTKSAQKISLDAKELYDLLIYIQELEKVTEELANNLEFYRGCP